MIAFSVKHISVEISGLTFRYLDLIKVEAVLNLTCQLVLAVIFRRPTTPMYLLLGTRLVVVCHQQVLLNPAHCDKYR